MRKVATKCQRYVAPALSMDLCYCQQHRVAIAAQTRIDSAYRGNTLCRTDVYKNSAMPNENFKYHFLLKRYN